MFCQTCKSPFEDDPWVLSQRAKVGPVLDGASVTFHPPKHCPACRRQRRHAFRNERNLYRRKCDKTGQDLVSIYSPEAGLVVYNPQLYVSDSWNALEYGLAYDPKKSFFEQFAELSARVPRRAIKIFASENCEYNNNIWHSKNAYLSYCSSYVEDSFYITSSYKIVDSADSFFSGTLECCSDIFNGFKLYECFTCWNCANGRNLVMCDECIGCSDCFGCFGLRQQRFCIYNERVTESEYREFIRKLDLGSFEGRAGLLKKVRSFIGRLPHTALSTDDLCENCIGDLVSRSKNSRYVFAAAEVEDCAWLLEAARNKDLVDADFAYDNRVGLECCASGGNYNCGFLVGCRDNSEAFYSMNCSNGHYLFGCISLNRGEYLILNKQYSREQYEALLPYIIDDMKDRGEWGEFFPPGLSDFGYNETDSMTYFPLERDAALEAGWKWSDFESPPPQVKRAIAASELPDNVRDADNSLLDVAIICEITGKPFKLQAQELAFYKKHSIALPRRHPNARHELQLKHQNPLALRDFICAQCAEPGLTTFPVGCPEPLVCKKCFMQISF